MVPSLSLRDLKVGYGDITVLWNISLNVENREIVGLLGSNGAGKTTLINTICGLTAPSKGELLFFGEDITFFNSTERVRIGITQIPEGRLLFSGLSVKQNLRMGAFARKDKSGIEDELDAIFHLFPVLESRMNQPAGTLSGGEQQMCAIGRGLMARPRLLMIDELSWGLAPVVVDTIIAALKEVYKTTELSLILIEQDVQLGLDLSHRLYVLENGRVVKEGRPEDLAKDLALRKAYLGI